MKTLVRIFLAVVILAIVAVAVLWFRIDAVAKSAIERGGTYALGVDTTVDSVSLSLLGGTAKIQGLGIGNPSGYEATHLMKSSLLDMGVEPGSLREDTVVINQIVIDGLELNIEKSEGKYNIEVISDNLKRFSGDEDADAPAEDEQPGKQYMVKKLVVRNVTATVDGPMGKVQVTPPDIELENVTQDSVPLDQLIAQLFPAITVGVIQAFPAEMADLSGRLTGELQAAAQALGGNAAKLLQQSTGKVAEQLQGVSKGAADAVGKVGEKLGEAAGKTGAGAGKKVGDAIGNFLGGGKDANSGE